MLGFHAISELPISTIETVVVLVEPMRITCFVDQLNGSSHAVTHATRASVTVTQVSNVTVEADTV